METILTFELELSFPAEIEPDASTLMETVCDAIRDHDGCRRLLPGCRRPRGGDRLTGISMALTKTRSQVGHFGISASSTLPDPPERAKTEPARDAIMDVSTQIDDRIEELREAQARLWEIFDTLWKAENARSVALGEQRAKRVMEFVVELLPTKMPALRRRKRDVEK